MTKSCNKATNHFFDSVLKRELPLTPGQAPVWQQSQPVGASVQVVPAETIRKSDSGSKMNVPLKKGKEAPAPFEEDFPDLGPSSGNAQSDSSGAKNGAKKKNKNKGKNNGFMIGDELIPSAEPAQSSQGKKSNTKKSSVLSEVHVKKKAKLNENGWLFMVFMDKIF